MAIQVLLLLLKNNAATLAERRLKAGVGKPIPAFLFYIKVVIFLNVIDDTNILDIAVDDQDLRNHIQELILQDSELQNNLFELKKLYENLQHEYVIQKVKLGSSSKLSNLLNSQGNKINITQDIDKDRILNQILQGYHLTSIILQQLHIIRKVNYTITYIDNKGNFRRIGNMEITPDMLRLEEASKGRGYSLRLKEGVVKGKIEASKTNDKAEALLNLHFQTFAKPFFDYEINNNTHWKANRGVIAEAFERHWEKLRHTMEHPEQMTPGDIESIGERWWMYRLSSGSDPYFTGPDTMYAQVKNANASFIDNLNTVINTINAIIVLTDKTNNIENLLEKAKKAFQANPQKMNYSKTIWNSLESTVQQQLMDSIGAVGYTEKKNTIEFIF